MQVFDTEDSTRMAEVGGTWSARARAVFDALGDGLVVWDSHDRILDCNERAAEILGRPRCELLHRTYAEILEAARIELDPFDSQGDAVPIEEAPSNRVRRSRGAIVGQVVGIGRTDGTRAWLEIDARLVHDDVAGDLVVSSFRDITERKQAEERTRALSAIVESSSDAVFRQTLGGIIESWNPGAEAVYGYTAAEAIGAHHDILVPADHRIEAEHLVIDAANGTSINNLLTVRRRKDGTPIQVVVTASPLYDAGGRVVGVSEIAGDVTELIEVRDALARSEEHFRSLVQRSSDVAFVLDEEGFITYASPDFGTGYSSLAYLKQLPVDCLKIDRSFIAGLPGDQHDRSITEAIVTLGRSLGLTIVAEGVETVEQWIALDELGCTVGQGYLWSPPIPASSFAPLITGLRRRTARSSARGSGVDAK